MNEPAIDIEQDPQEPEQEAEATEEKEPEQAAAQEPEKEPVVFSDEQQEIFNKEIAKKVAKLRETERQLEDERRAKEELASKIKPELPPNVPDLPDPFDDDYADKIRAREEAIAQTAIWNAQQGIKEEQARREAEADAQRQRQEENEKVKTYSERAEKIGIAPEKLQAAARQVNAVGIGDDIARFILSYEQGPAITVYLSENPLEHEKINELDPISAGIYINEVIKNKAMASREKTTTPPAPVDTPSGIGAQPGTGDMAITFE